MARKKRPSKLRPKAPSRVRRSKKKARTRSHHYAELIGLALVAFGLFLAAVLYGGWSAGVVGGRLTSGLEELVGAAVYVLPVASIAVGALALVRSRLVDVRPFRLGLVVTSLGLLLVLGDAHGGYAGPGSRQPSRGCSARPACSSSARSRCSRGAPAHGRLGGGDRPALARGAVQNVRRRASRSAGAADGRGHPTRSRPRPAPTPLVDGVHDYPDLTETSVERARSSASPRTGWEDTQPSLFDPAEVASEAYRLPDRAVLRRSTPTGRPSAGHERAGRGDARRGTRELRGRRDRRRRDLGAARHALRAPAGPGTKVAKVAALKDDLSYALATTEIRILAPIPGKQAVGVEVPNLSPNLVTLGDVFDDLPQAASPLSVWLGKDISGNAVWTDLSRMPHILIAGTTGSGKSGCINTILTSILLRATPDEVRMILVDPKRIELGYYESIPHLLTPVVSSPKQAAAALTNVVGEMERRYERMSLFRARSLPEMNRALRSRGEAPLPYLLVVIDELADLMMISPQDVEDSVIRLAQKSRAVGIHLVLATQRPSVDVITGDDQGERPQPDRVRGLEPDRLARHPRPGGRRDASSARATCSSSRSARRASSALQGAYVTEEEVALVVEQCRAQRAQELDESLLVAPEREPTRTATTTSTPTRTRCSRRRSRSSSRRRRPRCRCSSAGCASATRARAG